MAHYEYSPFGQLNKAEGVYAHENPFRFSSEYYDSETSLVYYNYRYYDPQLGRWLSRDPIQELGGENLYGHTQNNPIDRFDRNGQMIGVAVVIITIVIFCSGCGEQTGTQKIEKAAEMGKDGQEIIEDTTTIVTSPNTGEQIDAAAGLA